MRPSDLEDKGVLLAGREKELERLMTALKDLPSVVLVQGEAGIGKSQLISASVPLLRSRGVRVAQGACHPLREPFPYHALAEPVRSLCLLSPDLVPHLPGGHTLIPLVPDMKHRLPSPPVGGEAATTPALLPLLAAVRALLEAASPVVLVVEDLHWSDEASQELLLLLTRNMPAGAGLVISYREEDLPVPGPVLGSAYTRSSGVNGLELHVKPLDQAAVHTISAHVLGRDLPREISGHLYSRSEGVPRIVWEDVATLQERETEAWTMNPAAVRDLAVPRAFAETFTARVRRLPPDGLAVVRAAAVLASPFEQSVVTEVAGLSTERGAEGLTAALVSGILHEVAPMSYAFRRALGCRTVYGDIPGPSRQTLHRRAVSVLWSRPKPPLAQIARQARSLGDSDMWIRQATTAADQAISQGDTGTAVSSLYEILENSDMQTGQLGHAALMLARIAFHRTEYRTICRALRRVLTAPALPSAVQGEIRLYLALLVVNHGGEAGGHRDLVQAIEHLQSRPELLARAQSALALREMTRSDEDARRWLALAEQAARDSGDSVAVSAARTARLTLSATSAEPDVWEAVERLPRQVTDPQLAADTNRTLHNVGTVALRLGHDERAERLLSDSRDMASFHGNAMLECYSRASLLELDWWTGNWHGLEQRLTTLCQDYPEMAVSRNARAVVVGCLALTRGEQPRALHHLRTASEKGGLYASLWAKAAVARVHLAEGEAGEARSLTARALKELGTEHQWWQACGLVPVAVEAAMACGQPENAAGIVTRFEQVAEGRDVPAAEAELKEARAHVLRGTDEVRAAAEFGRASTLWQALGRPYQAALATERQADALLAAGSPGMAGTQLRTVIETYGRLEATSDVARCERVLREMGQVSPRPRGRRSYGSRLSPREVEVARLVAQGASNRDIARALFLSPRTVEHHVTKVLRKLDVSDRHGVDQALAQTDR
ncbi:ATP-binding protein [Streptomyces sp. NPDC054887]